MKRSLTDKSIDRDRNFGSDARYVCIILSPWMAVHSRIAMRRVSVESHSYTFIHYLCIFLLSCFISSHHNLHRLRNSNEQTDRRRMSHVWLLRVLCGRVSLQNLSFGPFHGLFRPQHWIGRRLKLKRNSRCNSDNSIGRERLALHVKRERKGPPRLTEMKNRCAPQKYSFCLSMPFPLFTIPLLPLSSSTGTRNRLLIILY